MERFTRLGCLANAHPGGAWSVAALPPTAGVGADTAAGAFLTGGMDGCVRLWRPPPPAAADSMDAGEPAAADKDKDEASPAPPPLYVPTTAGDGAAHPAGVLSLAVAAGAPVALSASLDGTVCRWRLAADAGAAAPVATPPADAANGGDDADAPPPPPATPPPLTALPPISRGALTSWAVAVTPDGSVAAVAGQGGTIDLYALGDGGGDEASVAGAPTGVPPPPTAADGAMCLALTPMDGGASIAAAYSDGSVAVLDVAGGRLSATLPSAAGAVRSLRRRGGGGGGGAAAAARPSVLVSAGNAERLASTLSRIRGAALKVGQMLSIQDADLLPPPLAAALDRRHPQPVGDRVRADAAPRVAPPAR